MREIKFLAWIKGHEVMVSVDFIDFMEREITVVDNEGAQRYFPFEEIEIRQFTGLHDKNGKEIYENDIVAVNSDKCGVVSFHDGAFYISNIGLINKLGSPTSIVQVIGNIHENPELLEGEQQ